MTAKQLVQESRSSLEEALQRGGVWQDWPGGKLDPAPAPFWGELVTERMRIPHRDPEPYTPMALACIPGALILDRALMADASGELYFSDEQFPRYINHWIRRGERPASRKPLNALKEVSLPGVSALVQHCHAEIYGHWLVECLPKLLYLHSLPIKPDRFVVERTALPHITKWITHIAPDVEIVNYDPETEYVRCEMLVSPTMACSPFHAFNPRFNPLLDEIAPARAATRLLYLDRVRKGDYHWVINSDELRETAQSFGFEVYYPLRQPVQEQIDVFASARVLAADYGSALHNSLFSSSNARVLAFNWVTQIQSRICQLRSQRLGFQLGETAAPVIGDGYCVNLDDAKRAFEAVLNDVEAGAGTRRWADLRQRPAPAEQARSETRVEGRGVLVHQSEATPTIEWLAEDRFRVGELSFVCTQDYTQTTSDTEIVLLKRRPFIEFYVDLLQRMKPEHLFEVGFFEGGSSLLWAALFPDMRITAIDLRKERPSVEQWRQRFGDRLQLNWGIAQDDEAALQRVVRDRGRPNLVIDDASHQLQPTRRTFEILFPLLARGEKYVIEDWAWGHWTGWNQEQWADAPTMSNLVVELVLATASASRWVSRVELDGRSCTITRGGAKGGLSLDEVWASRGRSLDLPD